jgi:hypothetical protein
MPARIGIVRKLKFNDPYPALMASTVRERALAVDVVLVHLVLYTNLSE